MSEIQQLQHDRMVAVLDWCSAAYRDQRMPASIYGDIMASTMLEARAAGVWFAVCSTLAMRGHAIFADLLRKEVRYAA